MPAGHFSGDSVSSAFESGPAYDSDDETGRAAAEIVDESPLDGFGGPADWSATPSGCGACGGWGPCAYCGRCDRRACCPPCGPLLPCGILGGRLLGWALQSHVWVRTDYLLWFMEGNPLPPLVSTSPDETPRLQAGVLGEPGTQVLFGDQRDLNSLRSGGRLEFGGYFDPCREYGFGGGFLGVGNDRASFVASSDGEPILARPFFSTLANAQSAALTAYSSTADGDVMAGSIRAQTSNSLMNANAFATKLFRRGCCWRWDLLAGYRYSRFDEDLSISDFMTVTETGAIVPRGTTFDGTDRFDVLNEFHGADIGLQFDSQFRRWALDGLLKVGFGNMHQEVGISGQTVISQPGAAVTITNGNFLAMDSNIGTYDRNKFACVPEARLNLSYRLTPALRLTAGYTFIYFSSVVRAGQAADTTVNPTQILPPVIGPPRPAFAFVPGDLWAQGINLGAQLRF